MLAEKRALRSQDPVTSDHVSPVISDHVSSTMAVTAPVVASGSILNKQQQQSQPMKILKKQSVTTVNTQPSSLHQQHRHKTPVVVKQPPTEPLPLLGMERRAHMMAERRQARMERQRLREEQLLVSQLYCTHCSN